MTTPKVLLAIEKYYKGFSGLFRRVIYHRPRVLFFSREPHIQERIVSGKLRLVFPEFEEFLIVAKDYVRFLSQLDLYQERYLAGDCPILAYDIDSLVHVAWFGERNAIYPDYELGRNCCFKLEEASVLIYDCWTPDFARGRGYYPEALKLICGISKNRFRRVWIYCLSDNISSKKGIVKAGFNLVGEKKGLRLFGHFIKCSG